ncbi:MAG: restriction endonuclease subunit S [Gammaproteobacteria bacterium]|nr:restriction endonuclease subunit S [Gammaproteobacteria bacterium]
MTSDVEVKVFEHIPEGWGCEKLIDCTTDGNISYGIVQPGQHIERGIPIIRVNNVNNGQLQLDDVLKVAPEIEEKYKRTRLVGGEVLLTLVGSTGQSFVAPEKLAGWNVPRAIAVIRPKEEIGADWINICLQSKPVQHFLDVRANTTVQKTLNLKDVRDIPIPIPPKEIKEQIESIAVSLQDKIQLNRQINQTLEQIAQAIFKSWFVDFEPVKAKIEAKQNGHDPERAAIRAISGKTDEELDVLSPEQLQQHTTTSALFPDEVEDSELGEIPKGWKVKPLDKIANYLNGLALQKFPAEEGEESLPVIKIAQLKKGDSNGADRASKNIKPEYVIENGDVIFSWSGSLFIDVWCGGKGALNQHLFKVTSEEFPKWFYFYWTNYHLAEFQRIAADKAVTMGHIKRGHLSSARCLVPDDKLINSLGEYVSTFVELSVERRLENMNLAELRNSLLPKLLSGEIEIHNNQNKEVA